jgi:hypothetical protein
MKDKMDIIASIESSLIVQAVIMGIMYVNISLKLTLLFLSVSS